MREKSSLFTELTVDCERFPFVMFCHKLVGQSDGEIRKTSEKGAVAAPFSYARCLSFDADSHDASC